MNICLKMNRKISIITICLIVISQFELSTASFSTHQGLYSQDIITSDLIVPRKVNHLGNHVSHSLTHFHDIENDDDEELHYHLPIGNETYHIELRPSSSFIAPLMVVERHRRDLKSRTKPAQQNCHYQGQIRGHDTSRVAMSACNGLSGFVHMPNGDYWVEPSKNHLPHPEKGHPHVVFQKSALKNGNNGQAKNNKKKKRRRRKRSSNCGTREPKRIAETKIEWQHQGKVTVQGGRRTRGHAHQVGGNGGGGGGGNKKIRSKRSISTPRHVETLIVADNSMVQFHQDGDLETYLLAIMNMVSSLYKDPSIGNLIHIIVVKIILLEEDSEPFLNVTHLADNNLNNFCRWQKMFNPKDESDPHHHDVAVLITRNNICARDGCATLGVANIAGMCRPDRACSVNEDNGITLAHTIAHELGHNFGMHHDTDKIGCEGRSGPILHVMTPSFEADTMTVIWSKCSRRDITHFLDQGLGKCLDDKPSEQEFTYPELPPGALYVADLQCRLQFNSTDESIKVCSDLSEICSQLWCNMEGSCVTLLRPAAPGTNCGRHMWCQNKECVPIEEMPPPVDGGWGNWSDYSECSRTCGGGISVKTRECNHPQPAYGGAFCVGERSRYKVCNLEVCPEEEENFRASQCSQYNNETFRGTNYTWLPYFDSNEPCELYCADTEDTIIVPWGDSAADGTPCNIGTNDMCISGICRKVGCDWIVDSNTTEDQCGVCGGDGSTCITIKREFNKKLNLNEGYYEITTIPSGSRHIKIEEAYPSKNFIAISATDSERFFLNGNRLVSMSGEITIAGSLSLYSRVNELDVLKIPGPTKEDISLHILFRLKQKSSHIRYEYTLSTNSSVVPTYQWKLGDWTPCTRTCGKGVQNRKPICYHVNVGRNLDEENCWSNAENERPEEKKRTCNEIPCSAHWWVGPWQLCPITCRRDGDPDPVKKRSIMCVDQHEIALESSHCENHKKPHDTEPCGTILPYCDSSEEISDNNTF